MRLIILLVLIISLPAYAQEKLDTKEYNPNYCQFTASFPTEPYITKKCEDPNKPETCFNLISFTEVFDLSTTVRVEIICNPGSQELFEKFTPKVMENTVRAMTKETVLETFEVKANEQEKYRQVGLVGKGRKGLHDSIFIAQLWIADQSVMSVEAEISGETREDADRLFADILRTIGFAEEINQQRKASESAPPSPENHSAD